MIASSISQSTDQTLHYLLLFFLPRCLIMSGREESKYNLEAVETLIRSGLISQTQFDVYLTSVLETGSSPAVSFVMQVMQRICSDDKNSPHNFTEVGAFAFCAVCVFCTRTVHTTSMKWWPLVFVVFVVFVILLFHFLSPTIALT